jgi:hypothetical protein
MGQVARRLSSGACKRDGAGKPEDGYGRVLRLTIELRYFECGTNTETLAGRCCSIFGACLTCRSSIVMPTPQSLRLRLGDEAQHAPSKLN